MAILEAQTTYGPVRGLPSASQAVSIFKGIPYAKPPVGELRFRAPEPCDSWTEPLDCYKFGPIAMQPKFIPDGNNTLAAEEFYVVEFPMSEDCLYLNIWTPAKATDEKLPVAVYIHGGGFETGYAFLNAYDGDAFAKRGVILVSIAYRLNVFGFLAHPDLKAENPHGSVSNYGLLDLVEGLKWVRDNIAAFGGDPDNVTIFGQSAGGACVENLLACPPADGLYKRAIMQSGGGLVKGPMSEFSEEQAYACTAKFMEHAGIKTVEELRALTANELIQKFIDFKHPLLYSENFMPCVDGYVHTLPNAEYFKQGKHPGVQTMVGCTADEMRRKGSPAPEYEKIAAMAEGRFGDLAEEYLEAIRATEPDVCAVYLEDPMGSTMRAGDIAWAINEDRLGRNPAYVYYFTYVPPGAEHIGAHHSVEHHFVFQTLTRSKRRYTGKDYDLSNKLCDYWTNFCKCGDPNGLSPEDARYTVSATEWRPYTAEDPVNLVIGSDCEMQEITVEPQVDFMIKITTK